MVKLQQVYAACVWCAVMVSRAKDMGVLPGAEYLWTSLVHESGTWEEAGTYKNFSPYFSLKTISDSSFLGVLLPPSVAG